MEVLFEFAQKTNQCVQHIGLILYKLENTPTHFYQRKINDLKRTFGNQNITFSIRYLNIPETNKGTFNSKVFFEQDINLFEI